MANKRGRPTLYTDELVQHILIHLRYGATLEDAGEAEGVDRTTIGRWMQRYPDFRTEVERARAYFVTHNIRNLNVSADRGSVQAAIWLIEHRGGPDYREPAKRIEVDATVHVDVTVLSDSDLDAYITRLQSGLSAG